jgi:Super-infection exclusion protein B
VDLSRILESLKLSPKYLFAVFAAGAFLLFAPLRFQVGLVEFRQRFLPYIGGATLISATLLLTHGIAALFDSLRSKREERKQLKSLHERLHSLTPAEKEALRPYIRGRCKHAELCR